MINIDMFLNFQSTLIFSILALSKFFIQNFSHANWYPFWYLGNPFYYLTGPVVPFLLLLASKVLPFSLYYLYIGAIVVSMVAGGVGTYLLVKDWDEEQQKSKVKNPSFVEATAGKQRSKIIGVLVGIFYVLLPFSWMMLYFQNGLKQIAFGIIPFIFILYKRFLVGGTGAIDAIDQRSLLRQGYGGQAKIKDQSHNLKIKIFVNLLLLVGLISTCLLITVNSLLPILIGITALLLTYRNDIKKAAISSLEEKIIKSIVILLLSISIATFWYTPEFWWIMLSNPSFGGVPLFNLIINLFKSLLNFLPIAAALIIVKFGKFRPKGYLLFAVLFSGSFLFLTVVRFISDPDFVIDWIGFMVEMQFGISVLAGWLWLHWEEKISNEDQRSIRQLADKDQKYSVKLKNYFRFALLPGMVIVLLVILTVLVKGIISYSKNDYQTSLSSLIKTHINVRNGSVPDYRIFLSGSDVFWINSEIDIPQVRGNTDGSSVHPFWAQGAYQIREGEKSVLALDWLKIFGCRYILVHGAESKEMFHDFKHSEKFTKNSGFSLVAEKDGDLLYEITDSGIMRTADNSIITEHRPINGADEEMLSAYVSKLKDPVLFNFAGPDTIRFKTGLNNREVVSMAVTYDRSWKIIKGKGYLVSDALGNMVFVPQDSGEQDVEMVNQRNYFDFLLPLILILLLIIFLLTYEKVYPALKRKMPDLSIGINEEEEY